MQEVVFWKALINTSKFKRGHQKTWAKTDRCTVSPDEAASQLTQQELVFVVQYSDGIEIQHWHLTVAVHNGACACPQCRQRWAPWNAETGWCLLFPSYRCEWSAHCNDPFRNSYRISMSWQCWHFLAGWPHTYFLLLTYCFNILPWLDSNKKKVITVSEETNGDESVTEAHKAWEVSARKQDWKIKLCFVVETFSKCQIRESVLNFIFYHVLNWPRVKYSPAPQN